MGVVTETSFLISGIIGYYKHYIKRKKEKTIIEQGI